jgi:histidinol phosphatase-like enzyme
MLQLLPRFLQLPKQKLCVTMLFLIAARDRVNGQTHPKLHQCEQEAFLSVENIYLVPNLDSGNVYCRQPKPSM